MIDIPRLADEFSASVEAFEADPCFLTLHRMIVAQERYLGALIPADEHHRIKDEYRGLAFREYHRKARRAA